MNTNENNNVITIDLVQIFRLLWCNLFVLIIAGLIGGFAMYFITSEFITNKFQSSTSIYVMTKSGDSQNVTYTDLQTGTQLTKDYSQLIKSRTVMNQVIADLHLQETYKDMENVTADRIAGMVSVTTQQDTRIVTITVTDTNPTRAQDIANAVRVAASKHIYQVMDIEAVNVVDEANLAERPVSPQKGRDAIIGCVLGALVMAAYLIIRMLMDDTIKNSDDVDKFLQLSVLASIPYDENVDTSIKKGRRKKSKNTSGSSNASYPSSRNMKNTKVSMDALDQVASKPVTSAAKAAQNK